MEKYLGVLRKLRGKDDARAALELERKLLAEALAAPDDRGLASAQRRLKASKEAVRIGSHDGGDFLVELRSLLTHMWLLGASGSGKSFLMLYLLLLVWWKLKVPVVVVDAKGEVRELLTQRLLPALIGRLPRAEAAALVQTVRVIDPFDASRLPPMNVLVRDAIIPVELQAMDVASSIITAVGASSGFRIDSILHRLLQLGIRASVTIATVRRAMDDGALLDALVRQVRDPELTRYFIQTYPAEPTSSKLALQARLDRLLMLPSTRAATGARASLDFGEMLDSGFTIIDLGRGPGGARDVTEFWATLFGTRLFRAVNARPPAGQARPTLLALDEWQLLLTPAFAADMETQLAIARSRNVSLWLANQMGVQLNGFGGLRDVANGMTNIQVMFRSTIDDARAMRHLLTTTGRVPRPKAAPWEHAPKSPFLTRSEELETLVSNIAELPQRHCWWWDRRQGTSALIRTATLDVGDPGALDHDLRDALAVGSVAVPVADLERDINDERSRMDALVRAAVPRALAPSKPGVPPGTSAARHPAAAPPSPSARSTPELRPSPGSPSTPTPPLAPQPRPAQPRGKKSPKPQRRLPW